MQHVRFSVFAAALAAVPLSLCAQAIWTGSLNSSWEEPDNWAGSLPPANSNATDAVLTGNTNTAITLPNAWSLQLLTFDASAGNFSLSGADLSLASGLSVIAGSHTLANAVSLGNDAQVNVKSGASVTFTGGGSGPLDVNPLADPDGANDSSYAGTVVLAGATSFDSLYVSGGLLQVNAATTAGQLSLIGTGTMELNAAGVVSDALISLMQDATLKLNATDAFTDSSVWFYALGDSPGGTIDLNGYNTTINAVLSFNYGGSAAESGWIVNTAAGESTVTFDIVGTHVFSGNTSNTGGGALNVVKQGSGTLVFGTAADSGAGEPGSTLAHTGATTINAGTLIVNGNVSSSTVTVNAGGTLAGIGVLRDVVVNGGTITAQDYEAVGTLTVQNLTLSSGSEWNFYLADATAGAGSGWTVIDVGNVLSLPGTTGSVTLTIAAGDFDASTTPLNFNPAQNYSFTIARFGTLTGFTPSVFALLDGGNPAFAGGNWSVAREGDELRLNYTAIPEPGAMAAIAGLLVLGIAAWRRRRS